MEKEFKITFPLDISEIRAIVGSLIVGSVQLVNGTATISDPRITTDSLCLISRRVASGTTGDLRINVSNNNTATITSSSSSDTSVVWYLIIPYAIISR